MSHINDEHRPPPAGITEEQLEFFTYQTERAVTKAHRMALRADQRRAKQRMVGFMVLFVAFLANAFYANNLATEARDRIIRSGDAVAVSGCNRDYEDREAIRRVLTASKDFTRNAFRRLDMSEEGVRLRLEFYDTQLGQLPLPDCRLADDVLTDDPDMPIHYPKPMYPGAEINDLVPPVSAKGGGLNYNKPLG